jgi:hypothetical protein
MAESNLLSFRRTEAAPSREDGSGDQILLSKMRMTCEPGWLTLTDVGQVEEC